MQNNFICSKTQKSSRLSFTELLINPLQAINK